MIGYIRPDGFAAIPHPARRPDGFEIRRKKRFDLSNQGICNPPNPYHITISLLRIANPQNINRLGHFLTTDCKSVETPSGG